MRKLRDRRPGTFFRGGELARLLSMIVMLIVLGMMFVRARDPKLWSFLAPDNEPDAVAVVAVPEQQIVSAEVAIHGPSDLDPEERDAAAEEFQAVTDQVPLAKEEMPAYWRMMAWQQHQTVDEMLERGTADVSFRRIFADPQKWRGKLVRIPLHLRQTADVEDVAENPLGLKSLQEAWGWTADSQPYFYWLVCPQLPPGMPRGKNIFADATFVGYFLKLIPYEDHEGIKRSTPLLIGKLIWHPTPEAPPLGDEWPWPWVIGGAALLLFVVRWGFWLARARRRTSDALASARRDEDGASVEDWLEQAGNDSAGNAGRELRPGESGPQEGRSGGWTPPDL